MAFILSRNAKLFVSTEVGSSTQSVEAAVQAVAAALDNTNTWQIPVLDGFSFSQATTTQEVQISEAGTNDPSRGQRVYNTALEPVNWSFSNYMRPRYDSSSGQDVGDAVERVLWEAHAAPGPAGPNSGQNNIQTQQDGLATTRTTNSPNGDMTVSYANSNTNQLLPISLFFKLDAIWYWIRDAVVDTAEIDFSIESIATITWNGFANEIHRVDNATALSNLNAMANAGVSFSGVDGSPGFLAAPSDTACIRNKLTTVTLQDTDSASTSYQLPITGGSITISNNITYLTPESLGVLNKPCAHFTGARTVNGNLTAYLRTDTNYSADLMAKLQSELTVGTDPENFDMDIYVGGGPSDRPAIQLSLPHAHLVVPVINLEDVITVDIGFSGLPYDDSTEDTWDLNSTNEVEITYKALA